MDNSFLVWPFFNDSHRKLAAHLEEWCEQNLADLPHHDEDAVCQQLVERLGKDGWLKHSAPDPIDPAGRHDVTSLCLIRETLARYHGLADFAFAMQGLGAAAIALFGNAEQKTEWLPRTRNGSAIAAFALTEPDSGSDVANIKTVATQSGNYIILNGQKTWISNGGIADFYVVFARTGEAAGHRGLSAFIVPADSEGLIIAERLHTTAPHPLARLAFDNCRITADNRLGEPGKGFAIAMAVLDVFRSTVGAAALGFARRAMDESLQRVSQRMLFDAPMSALPLVQTQIADMALEIDAAALLIYRAAWTRDQGQQRITREAAMAKLYATEAAQRVIDSAVQLHGGDGVRKDSVAESLYREIRALRIYEGASEVQKLIIARQTLAGG